MLQICHFFILNAAPTAKVQHQMQADPDFQSSLCVWGGGVGMVNKSTEFFHILGHVINYSPLFAYWKV